MNWVLPKEEGECVVFALLTFFVPRDLKRVSTCLNKGESDGIGPRRYPRDRYGIRGPF